MQWISTWFVVFRSVSLTASSQSFVTTDHKISNFTLAFISSFLIIGTSVFFFSKVTCSEVKHRAQYYAHNNAHSRALASPKTEFV
jgi:hypothetical protein